MTFYKKIIMLRTEIIKNFTFNLSQYLFQFDLRKIHTITKNTTANHMLCNDKNT